MKSLKLLLLCLAFAGVNSAIAQTDSSSTSVLNGTQEITDAERRLFRAWCHKFGKQYKTQADEDSALKKYLANKAIIDEHNKLHDDGKVSFRRGLWKYSDMSEDEKNKFLTGVKVPPQKRSAPFAPSLPQFPPGGSSVNWATKGLVGPVMDQGW